MTQCEICSKIIPKRNKRFCSLACSIKKPTNYWKGKKFSQEYKNKLSEAHKGKNLGELHPNWRGEEAGYYTKHNWMTRHYGKPNICEHCYSTNSKRYEWANISGNYIRDRSDWLRLCKSCHAKFDDIGNRSWITRRKNASDVH